MSNSLRDMFVGIVFRDEASRAIDSVNRSVNNVEHNVHGLGRRVDDTSDGFRSMGRVGINATNDVEDGFNDAEREARGFTREVGNSEGALSGIKKAALGIGSAIAGAFAVDKIKDFAVSGIELAAGTKALTSQFDQVFDGMQSKASSSLNNIAEETGVLPDRLKGSYVQMAAFAKTTGADTAAALSLTERATLAAADGAAFYDRSIEDVTDNLQSFLKGNFENDAALGISATETTRNAKANALYGKSFTKLSEAQKQLTLLAMVEDGNKAAGAIGQAARESDGYENVIGNLKGTWDGLKGTMMTPFLDTVTNGLQDLTAKMQGVDAEKLGNNLKKGFDTAMDVAVPTFQAVKDGIGWLIDNKETIMAVSGGIAAGFAAFHTAKTAIGIFDKIKNLGSMAGMFASFANPLGIAVVAIGGLVAAGIYLYRNWDTVKEKAGELWVTTKEIFGKIKTWIPEKLTEAKDKTIEAVGSMVDNAKTKFGEMKQGIYDNLNEAKNKVFTIFTEMPYVVSEKLGFMVGTAISWISQLPTKFSENFGLAKDLAVQKISELPGLVMGFLSQTKDNSVSKLTELSADFTTWFTTAKDNAVNVVTELPGQIAGFVGQIPGAVAGKIVDVYSKFKELGSSIPQAIGEGFEATFASLGKGVKWAFDKLVGGVTSLKSVGSGMASSFNEGVQAGGGIKMDGSHATGLASVPHDNYRANLHRGESVLTATQSDALRGMGVLSANSDGTPDINSEALTNTVAVPTQLTNGNNVTISAPISLTVQGNADDATIQKLLSMLDGEVRRIFEEIFRQKLAGLGG